MPGGNKNIKGSDGKKFSKDYQPSPESKKAGKRKAKALKEVAEMLIKGDMRDKMIALADTFGIEIEEVTVELAMHLKQMERALQDGDTRAYTAAMDRIKGKPIQEIKQETKHEFDGDPFQKIRENNNLNESNE